MSTRIVQLLEFTQVGKAREVDEQAGVLRGLKILGNVSGNGREYPAATIERAARIYEGRPSNANHNRKRGEDADVNNRLGVWIKTYVENGELYGDFAYLKSHPLSARLVEAARRPELNRVFGFSHDARGRERREGGKAIIEAIDEVKSIDLVSDPASVSGLYESLESPMTMKLSALVESLKKDGKRPGYLKALTKLLEDDNFGPDMGGMSAPAEPAAGAGPDEGVDHEQAIYDAAKAVIDDDALDVKAKLKKIQALLKLCEQGADEAEEPEETETEAEESLRGGKGKGTALVEQLQLQIKVRDLCADAGLKPGKVLRKALDACAELKEAQELIDEAKKEGGGRGGLSNPPSSHARKAPTITKRAAVRESRDGNGGGGNDAVENRGQSIMRRLRGRSTN